MSLIDVSHLSFTHEGGLIPVFDDVSFQIDTDWRLGLTGRNGRGKTTLLRLLTGELDAGDAISKSVACDYFPLEPERADAKVGEVLSGLTPERDSWEFRRELSKLEAAATFARPFAELSPGERGKVLLAALFLRRNRFLLIDEPTNHLDANGRALVAQYLAAQKGFVLVSHDRAFLDGCVDHILTIGKAGVTVHKGNFSSWWANRELREQFERSENEKLRKDIRKLKEAAERTTRWSDVVERSKYRTDALDKGYIGHRAAKMMKRSKSLEARREKAAEEKSTLLREVEEAEALRLYPLSHHSETLVELEEIEIFYGEKAACPPVSFEVRRGDRLALRGANGSGKSSLLKLITGDDLKHTGALRRAGALIISRVPQDASSLRGDLSAYAARKGVDETLFKAILRKLDFSRPQFERDMGDYSAGQKKKVLLACSLCERAHLYVWDEPLNFIDVFSRIQIEELLLAFSPTLLFVEHDRAFSEKVATKVVEL